MRHKSGDQSRTLPNASGYAKQPRVNTSFKRATSQPAASINNDTWFYTLLNNELSVYQSHPDFIDAWPTGFSPPWNSLSYSIVSPVKSIGGQYAATFTGSNFQVGENIWEAITVHAKAGICYHSGRKFNPSLRSAHLLSSGRG